MMCANLCRTIHVYLVFTYLFVFSICSLMGTIKHVVSAYFAFKLFRVKFINV